ncbi:hypothetical protein OUZ56_020330 [Daphnia magna]|uniref:Uncharacterized protein n=1 Tax=Daphnia magna TaxID=35525 RepID=A0ABQ9ZE71_9CRUS|nr:hypothetical protein OUZ56_020330 [Daphnia magna]
MRRNFAQGKNELCADIRSGSGTPTISPKIIKSESLKFVHAFLFLNILTGRCVATRQCGRDSGQDKSNYSSVLFSSWDNQAAEREKKIEKQSD